MMPFKTKCLDVKLNLMDYDNHLKSIYNHNNAMHAHIYTYVF